MPPRRSPESYARFAVPALLVLLAVVAATNGLWLTGASPALVGIDSWDFYPASLHYFRYVTGMEEAGFEPLAKIGSYRGPLLHWASLPLPLLFGPRPWTFAVTGTLFFLALLGVVFALGRRLFGPGPGLLAAALLAATPIVLMGSRSYNLEIPMAALVALSVYFLVRSENLAKPGWAAAYGLAGAAAMLTKGVAFLYFLPPLGGAWLSWLIARFGRSENEPAPSLLRALTSTVAGLGVAFGVSLLWYRDGFVHLWQTIFSQVDAYWQIYEPFATEGGQSFWSQTFVETGVVFAAAGVIGLVTLLWARPRGFAVIAAWVLTPVIGFLSGPADFARFLTASYAGFALAAAFLVHFVWQKQRWIGSALATVLLVAGGWTFILMQTPLNDDRPPVIATPGQVYIWRDRDTVIEHVRQTLGDGAGRSAVIYTAQNIGTVPPKAVYTHLAMAFPQLNLDAASADSHFGYRFQKLCEHVERADLLIELLPTVPVFRSDTGRRPPQPPPPPAASTRTDDPRVKNCLAAIDRLKEEMHPVATVTGGVLHHSTDLRILARPLLPN
jgi:4-amino-4-deoxy-L-arabinose transferase-like glycosyltransferase